MTETRLPTPLPATPEMENEITFSKTLGGEHRDRGINVIQTSHGGYAVVGYTSSFDAVQDDVYLVRLDPHER